MASAINGVGEILRLARRPAPLSREELFETAARNTGLTDWGDENFLAQRRRRWRPCAV